MVDKRKHAKVNKGYIDRMPHVDQPYVEKFIEDVCKSVMPNPKILNGCCGNSRIGQIRFDIDKNSNRTMDADLRDQLKIFRPGQVDFYYVDPPDAWYNPFSKFIAENYYKGISGGNAPKRKYGDPYRWQYDALEIPRKALILQGNLQMCATNWPESIRTDVEYFLTRDQRPMGRILQIIWKK